MKSTIFWHITPFESRRTFRRNISHPSSGLKNKLSKTPAWKPAFMLVSFSFDAWWSYTPLVPQSFPNYKSYIASWTVEPHYESCSYITPHYTGLQPPERACPCARRERETASKSRWTCRLCETLYDERERQRARAGGLVDYVKLYMMLLWSMLPLWSIYEALQFSSFPWQLECVYWKGNLYFSLVFSHMTGMVLPTNISWSTIQDKIILMQNNKYPVICALLLVPWI
jgi:hypothetical protein